MATEGQHQGQVFPALCSVQVPKQNQACPSSSHLLGESALPVNTSERCLSSPEILGGWSEKRNIIIVGTLVPTSLGSGGSTLHRWPLLIRLPYGFGLLWVALSSGLGRLLDTGHTHVYLVSCSSLNTTSNTSLLNSKVSHCFLASLQEACGKPSLLPVFKAPHLLQNE